MQIGGARLVVWHTAARGMYIAWYTAAGDCAAGGFSIGPGHMGTRRKAGGGDREVIAAATAAVTRPLPSRGRRPHSGNGQVTP